MTEEGDMDHNAVIRGILESMVSGEVSPKGVTADSVAQLLVAAINKAEHHNMLAVQGGAQAEQPMSVPLQEQEPEAENANFGVNSFGTEKTNTSEQKGSSGSLNAPASDKPRMLCVKLPLDVRKRIVALRKEGKKCREIAKELTVSVSGVRKVWERFLATGMVHDRKPNSGRPRKYPAPSTFELQYTPAEEVVNTDSSPHIEYVTISEGDTGVGVATNSASSTLSDSNVFVEDPLDMPGATVEIVETDPHPVMTPQEKKAKKGLSVYREQLLLRLIEDCPLATLREDASKTNSPHITNLNSISRRSLYMENVLGHPFGHVPSPRAFEADLEEAKVILTDPVNPLSKDMLASLGYSTKVYFNMCCKPSPLFDQEKLISDLPFFMGPGHIGETTKSVVQLLVNLCKDPVAALSCIPTDWFRSAPPDGPVIEVQTERGYSSVQISVPKSLSLYWNLMYQCASDFQCCENFLSASPPSAPCLLCHPFQKLAEQLEIREPTEDEIWNPTPSRGCGNQSQPLNSIPVLSRTPSPDSEVPMVVQEGVKKTGRRRGRQKKSLVSEDHLVIDGHFEVPTPVETSGESVSVFHQPPDSEFQQPPASEFQRSLASEIEQPSALESQQPPESSEGLPVAGPDQLEMELAASNISPAKNSSLTSLTVQQSNISIETPTNRLQDDVPAVEELKTPGPSELAPQSESSGPPLRRSQRKRTQRNSSPSISVVPLRSKRQRRNRNSSPRSSKGPQPEAVSGTGHRDELGGPDPLSWGVEDVVEFVARIPRCNYSTTFREHEVDGESLLSLDPEMMVKLMGIKAGPALKIHRKIIELKGRSRTSQQNTVI